MIEVGQQGRYSCSPSQDTAKDQQMQERKEAKKKRRKKERRKKKERKRKKGKERRKRKEKIECIPLTQSVWAASRLMDTR